MSSLIALALLAQAAPANDAPTVARMIALYDELCLRTYPDDAKLDAAMRKRKAIVLTPDQVKVTLRDNPGRGWVVKGGGAPVMVLLELPPYHVCSVRALVGDGPHDLAKLDAATAAYTRTRPGFAAEPEFNGERGGIRIHLRNQTRALPDGGVESLMVIDQQVTDSPQLAPGSTAAPLRFVHQIRAAK